MKKIVLNMLLACLAISFAACSSNNDAPDVSPQAPELSVPKFEKSGLALQLKDAVHVPFSQVTLSETGRAVVGPIRSLRAQPAEGEYLVGTFVVKDNAYVIYDKDGKEYCKLVVKNPSAQTTGVDVQMAGEKEPVAAQATVASRQNSADKIARSWAIAMARLRHSGDVTAVHHFENPQEASSLNAILDYAKSKAGIDETFEADMKLEEVVVTKSGTFVFIFKNGQHYVGKWSWKDAGKGLLSYQWNDQKMGNKFENGTGVFDVRTHKNIAYYALTLSADVAHGGKKYNVELTFYLKEVKR